MKAKLACDYLDEAVDGGRSAKRFRMEARQFLTEPLEQSHETADRIMDSLERKGHMTPGKYEDLKELVKPIDVRMVKIIEDTEREMDVLDDDDKGKSFKGIPHVSCFTIKILGKKYNS